MSESDVYTRQILTYKDGLRDGKYRPRCSVRQIIQFENLTHNS